MHGHLPIWSTQCYNNAKSTCHRKGENAELSKRYELIAFDLDGTLGQHKTPISDKHLELLRNLKRYQLVIAGAGTCQRIYNQVRSSPLTFWEATACSSPPLP